MGVGGVRCDLAKLLCGTVWLRGCMLPQRSLMSKRAVGGGRCTTGCAPASMGSLLLLPDAFVSLFLSMQGNEFGHPEWIDFPRDDT